MNVCVVIPAFNSRATLGSAVRSALGQTGVDQVVIVDDGSTDSTVEVAAAIDDARVSVRSQQQAGPGAARNRGAAEATTSHLVFLDADDHLLPDALDVFRSAESSVELIRAGAVLRTEGADDVAVLAESSAFAFPRGAQLAGSFAVSRAVFEQVGGYDPAFRYGENSELLMRVQHRLLSAGRSVSVVPKPTVVYSQHLGRPDDLYRGRRLDAVRLMLDKHRDLLRRDPETLHNHLAIGSELSRQLGDGAGARRFAAAALRVRPGSPRSWARWARAATIR